jgi:peptide/nickel transport system substrate-binding protein
MMSWVFRGLAVVVSAAILASCTKPAQTTSGAVNQAAKTHYLTIADGTGDIPTLNPHLFTESTIGYISELTQAYLTKWDSHDRPYPELTTVVPTQANGGISKDGKTITWHLRRGVRWSDGAPFDADDVVFSTHAVLNPANNEVGRDGWDLITKIDEPDKYTVVFHLSRPYSAYLPTFFGSLGANPDVLPKHLLAKYPNINNVAYNSKPVGIGPFRVVDWKRGDSVEMEANPYYFRGEPKIKRITYKLIPSRDTLVTLMQTGDVDVWPEVEPNYLPQVKAIQTLNVDVAPAPWYLHLDFNVTRPLVSDLRVREAIRYAIDRNTLVQKVVHGYGIVQDSVISPAIPGAPKDIPTTPFDPAKARQLLDQAGWKVGPGGIRVRNGQRLSLQLPYGSGNPAIDDAVEFMRAELKSVGIQIDTRKYAPAQFFAPFQDNGIVYGGKWDMTLFNWQTTLPPDISPIWECKQIPPNGQNVTHFCNKRLDQLLEEFKGTYDEAAQAKILDEEAKIIAQQVPTIVLYVWKQGYAYKKTLTGWHPNTWTPFDNILNADI